MRKLINTLHLWLGLISGIIIFTVAVTGCIYCFEEELRGFIHRDLLNVEKPDQPVRPLEEQIKTVKDKYPDTPIKSIRIKGSDKSTEFIFKDKLSVFVNPYTGEILGSFNKETDLFGVSLKIHRSLYLEDTGKLITGTSALIFVFMILSGIILWWPKRSKFKLKKFSIRRNAGFRKANYDLHSVLGFYASWIIIFTALTGLIWSFKWAENTMYWLASSKKEERKTFTSKPNNAKEIFTLNEALSKTDKLYPGSREKFISLPEDSTGVYRVFLKYDNTGFLRRTNQVYLDQYSGEIIKAQAYQTASLGDRLKASNYDIHTGKVLGLPGQFLVFFAGLITASLPITGFMLWWKKQKSKVILS